MEPIKIRALTAAAYPEAALPAASTERAVAPLDALDELKSLKTQAHEARDKALNLAGSIDISKLNAGDFSHTGAFHELKALFDHCEPIAKRSVEICNELNQEHARLKAELDSLQASHVTTARLLADQFGAMRVTADSSGPALQVMRSVVSAAQDRAEKATVMCDEINLRATEIFLAGNRLANHPDRTR